MKYHVEIIKQDSRGKDKIIDNGLFNTRQEANDFINKHNPEPRPYKTEPRKIYYTLDAR